MKLQLSIRGNSLLDLSFDNTIIGIGNNHNKKREIYSYFERMSKSSTLSGSEELYFGQDGIQLFLDDKKITSKNSEILCISNFNDIIQQYTLSKGTLMENCLLALSEDFEINKLNEKINELLFEMELLISNKISSENYFFNLELKSIEVKEIVKLIKDISIEFHDQQYPLNFAPNQVIIRNFIYQLELKLQTFDKHMFLIINGPELFLSHENAHEFINNLLLLAQNNPQLHLIIFHYHDLSFYTEEFLSEMVIFSKEIHQLPEMMTFQNSIANHWPKEYLLSKENLWQLFVEIALKNNLNNSINSNNENSMILLSVLEQLIGG